MPRPAVRTLTTDLAAVDSVVEELARGVGVDEWAGDLGFRFRTALTEALVNAMKHGNGCDPSKAVEVAVSASEKALVVRVSDQGSGFDPVKIPDPTQPERIGASHGRGVFLMRSLCEDVSYNSAGNEVTLTILAPGGHESDGQPHVAPSARATVAPSARATDAADARTADATDARATDAADARTADATDARATDAADARTADATDARATDAADARTAD